MKNTWKKRLIAIAAALLLGLLAYFAADIPFYPYQEPLERASLQSVSDGEPLAFTYSSDAITLHGADHVTVYGLTLSGMAVIPNGQAASFPADSLGTLAAVKEPYTADTNGDGILETVTDAAKTDMEFTQEYTEGGNTFLDSRLPFEATIQHRSGFSFTLYSVKLSNAEITAVLSDGREIALQTDENGFSALSLNDLRDGVTFWYRPDNQTTYRLAYQVEDNTVFSLRWLEAMERKPARVFVNHGDDENCECLAGLIADRLELPADAPFSGLVMQENYSLHSGRYVL